MRPQDPALLPDPPPSPARTPTHTSEFRSNLPLHSHPRQARPHGRRTHSPGSRGPSRHMSFLPGPSLDLPWPGRAQSGCRCLSVRPSPDRTTVSSLALQSSSTLGVTPGTPECGKETRCSSREGSSPPARSLSESPGPRPGTASWKWQAPSDPQSASSPWGDPSPRTQTPRRNRPG